ncbi:WD40 repeat-like protein [Gonapodya prolifera JEL478]|uniref:WD40 repeat-like protein n=1 Tax=Gonapodya prolifera (strain JEL478) TaxID=1344416 RepID=A0A139AJR5_GONPJ|nr:WD40 repeat-like protein [Gonapodya prolifera JEL478]|eukprot:KXS17027.1 WD40 repeat-like protein [Gonapodya prolifera JEL478]
MRSLLPGVLGDPGEDGDDESARRRWYEDNLIRLTHLAAHLSTSPGAAPAPSELKAWDWEKEISGFWDAVRKGGSGETFGDAVGWMVGGDGEGQLGDDVNDQSGDWPEWDLLTLSRVIAEVIRAVSERPARGAKEGVETLDEQSSPPVDEVEPIKVSVVPAPPTPKVDQYGTSGNGEERSKTPNAGKCVDSTPQASSKPPTNLSSARRPRTPPSTVRTQHHAPPPASDGRSAVSSVSFAEFDTSPLLPPAPSRPESAEFAFAGSCGPFVSAARVLDVAVRPDGSVISATCPADPHLDRTISIHLLTLPGPHLVRSLDTGTPRPVVALSFHPTNPTWLLTADMDHCVKLWDVDTGAVLRTWRKWHTRVVHRCGWVPHSEARAWTCSGDQSVKVWDATGDEGDEDVARVHGTEPFVGVVFSGQGVGQMMVVAMAYALRVYKVRTMGVLRTVVFGELRGSKTPITCISSHPVHDSFALVSCDNQVRLVELAGMTTLKVYNAREIGPGTRIEAHFSPCGAFIYAGSLDPRTLTQHTPGSQPSNTSPTYSQRYGLPRPTLSGPPESVLPPSETSQYHSPLGTGVFVWRVHTGKLERVEMMAMETGAGARVGVGACRWVAVQGDKEHVGARGGKKVLVSVGADRVLRVFR